MSLEEAIQSLTDEIKQLNALLTSHNELLKSKEPLTKTHKLRLLNEKEAAEYIGMSRSFLSQDRMNGFRQNRTKGPNPIKLGRKVKYDIDELDAWIMANKVIRSDPY